MIQAIEEINVEGDAIDVDKPIKLELVPIKKMISEGLNQSEIARRHNQKQQNVSRFFIKYREDLKRLDDEKNLTLILEIRELIALFTSELKINLTDVKQLKKIGVKSKVLSLAILIDKLEKLMGKDDLSISITHHNANMEETERDIEEINDRISKQIGSPVPDTLDAVGEEV